MSLNYADRCERYAWIYDPKRIIVWHLTPRQRRRALHKERHQMARKYGRWERPPRDYDDG